MSLRKKDVLNPKLGRLLHLGRIEVANLLMVGHTSYYCGEMQGALDHCLAAVAMAKQVGHRRAEIIARIVAGLTAAYLNGAHLSGVIWKGGGGLRAD